MVQASILCDQGKEIGEREQTGSNIAQITQLMRLITCDRYSLPRYTVCSHKQNGAKKKKE